MNQSAKKLAPSRPAEQSSLLNHMAYEETVVLPQLHPQDAAILQREHDRYRRLLKRGFMPTQSDLDKHEQLEQQLYQGVLGSTH